METARPAPPKSLAKTLTNILRPHRSSSSSDSPAAASRSLKSSKTLGRYPPIILSDSPTTAPDDQKTLTKQRDDMETVLANLFVGISAIKAAYAQLQVAQFPYNPDAIQSADEVVVYQLKHLSQLKHAYLKKQPPDPQPALSAQIQEQRNLLKTYQITAKKLEADLLSKDDEIGSLKLQLADFDHQCSNLDAKLHPNRSLSALRELHLSGLNPTHFLSALRYTVKSIRHFVKYLVREMESAGWDISAAAGAIHPDVLRRGPTHSGFALESYVCLKMFSGFNRRDFGVRGLDARRSWDRRRCFEEFSSWAQMSWNQCLEASGEAARFARAKYLAVVHPKMEASFFGDLEQRAAVSGGGRAWPETAFLGEFAEMARRVWVLHCLFCSFTVASREGETAEGEGETGVEIFQVGRGMRFSEVYMESVAEEEEGYTVGKRPVVAFTVVPGFRVGRAVIQSRVYLSGTRRTGGRS